MTVANGAAAAGGIAGGDDPSGHGTTARSDMAASEKATTDRTEAIGAEQPQRGATLPERAQVVVVGGGIIGTSVAYHLAHAGLRDVLLLERDRLTSGTTWHAAGLMATFGSTSQTSTELRTTPATCTRGWKARPAWPPA